MRPVVGPRLRRLLQLVLVLFALLIINSVYLAAVTLLESLGYGSLQTLFYQYMFLGHLALGLLLLLPFLVYGVAHWRRAHSRPNRRAVRAGLGLFGLSLTLLLSGLLLTRGLPLLEIRHPDTRRLLYWLHVVSPLLVVWMFVLHRLAGPSIRWWRGAGTAVVALALTGVSLWLLRPQAPASGPDQQFGPSLAQTADGQLIPADTLMRDGYCANCHGDAHEQWRFSAHRFASFNNPAYRFSVENTRAVLLERDGHTRGARFCAGCHDLVPLFSGEFDRPDFDPDGASAQAGITCTACHAISAVNSPRGNADYTISQPEHYPFAFSSSGFLSWVSDTLIRAKPDFHKSTFLKPVHRTPEFCGACHKVHLPRELNQYRWLRGQNHFDSFTQSGVAGTSVSSFHYPEQARENCGQCHMPLRPSDDFGARPLPENPEVLAIHDHGFPGANTALPHLLGFPDRVMEQHQRFLAGAVTVDIFSLREGGSINGELLAPLGAVPVSLQPGRDYLLEVVLRNRKTGHLFTEGTADSNQVWLELTLSAGDSAFARSGFISAAGDVDPAAHFVNAYVIDRQGRRIDRRNAEDIFTTLYNNQIPPGAADTVLYRFTTPPDLSGPVTIEASLNYRKFDSRFFRLFQGQPEAVNDLPVTRIDTDRRVLGQDGQPVDPNRWQRWNDYGIGLLLKEGTGALRQAEAAFQQVVAMGRPEGLVNLARVYLREGRVDDAEAVLQRASREPGLTAPWTVDWLTGQVNFQNGYIDEAIAVWSRLVDTPYPEARHRGFNFGRDYRLLEQLGMASFERARAARLHPQQQAEYLRQSIQWYERALALEPELASTHYGLSRSLSMLGDDPGATRHRQLHDRYRSDDNARDRAVSLARAADPVAALAADDVVVYPLGGHDD